MPRANTTSQRRKTAMKVGSNHCVSGIWWPAWSLSACGGGRRWRRRWWWRPGVGRAPAPRPGRSSARPTTPTAPTRAAPPRPARWAPRRAGCAPFDEAYLWYGECPWSTLPRRPTATTPRRASHTSIDAYFEALKVTSRDRFSFTYPTKAWDTLFQSGADGMRRHPVALRLAQTAAQHARGIRGARLACGQRRRAAATPWCR